MAPPLYFGPWLQDPDPDGAALAGVADPLAEAIKLVAQVLPSKGRLWPTVVQYG